MQQISSNRLYEADLDIEGDTTGEGNKVKNEV